MLTHFKINSALIICLAFIFRVLFVNVGVISALTASQTKTFTKHQFSSGTKKRMIVETQSNSITSENSPMEVCEEDSNEENGAKSYSFFLIQVLFSFASNNLDTQLTKIPDFSKYAPYTSSDRLLAFQVFRI